MLVADILAYTLCPNASLNGAAIKTEIGIVQRLAVTIAALDPSQLAVSVLYVTSSSFLINTV